MTLKNRTISGMVWSFLENISRKGISFIVGIVLARLLSPEEFGLIGMIMIFIAVSQDLMRGGFPQALIRKNNCTQQDFSTVFYFNLLAGLIVYFLLFISSKYISNFFKEPILEKMVMVVGIGVVINAFGVVHRAILTRKMNFKLQMKIAFIASIISGITGIVMAYLGYGVWSLVIKILIELFITSLLLIFLTRWKPSLEFSKTSFKEMFGFGFRLLITRLIETVYTHIYNLVIGRFFSAASLGFYTRADLFKKLSSENLNAAISRVSYPALSTIKENNINLKNSYRRILKTTMFINLFILFGMVVIAEPMILTLLGVKWAPSIVYLQLLCFAGVFFPIRSLNLNMLKVKGRSDLMLRLQIFKKILVVPIIIIGVYDGIKTMIVCMIFYEAIAYYLDSYYSGKLINYKAWEQIMDIFPIFFIMTIVWSLVYLLGFLIQASSPLIFLIQGISGSVLVILFCELYGLESYKQIKGIVLERCQLVFKK